MLCTYTYTNKQTYIDNVIFMFYLGCALYLILLYNLRRYCCVALSLLSHTLLSLARHASPTKFRTFTMLHTILPRINRRCCFCCCCCSCSENSCGWLARFGRPLLPLLLLSLLLPTNIRQTACPRSRVASCPSHAAPGAKRPCAFDCKHVKHSSCEVAASEHAA